jgi:hypothetical protein
MSDVVPVLSLPITATRVITNPDGTVGLEEYVVREVVAESYTRKDGTKGSRLVLTTDTGFGAIVESGVLTETHTIYVKAFDRAGNEAKSEPVRIRVSHKPKEKKTSALLGEPGQEISDQGLAAWLLPDAALSRGFGRGRRGDPNALTGESAPTSRRYLPPLT